MASQKKAICYANWQKKGCKLLPTGIHRLCDCILHDHCDCKLRGHYGCATAEIKLYFSFDALESFFK